MTMEQDNGKLTYTKGTRITIALLAESEIKYNDTVDVFSLSHQFECISEVFLTIRELPTHSISSVVNSFQLQIIDNLKVLHHFRVLISTIIQEAPAP